MSRPTPSMNPARTQPLHATADAAAGRLSYFRSANEAEVSTITPQSKNPRGMAPDGMTPAGMQRAAVLARRRMVAALLNGGTYLALLAWLGWILSHGGWSLIDAGILLCFAMVSPWGILGFWNSTIGLWLLRRGAAGTAEVAPFAAAGDNDAPVTSTTAIAITVYNEPPERAFRRLAVIRDSIERTGWGDKFSYFILSDTQDPDIAEAEEEAFRSLKTEAGPGHRLHYRRRSDNEGYKAGNIRDFCETDGRAFDFMLTLDADSLMDGQTIVRMVRMCQAWPRIGILQSLVVGAPSRSAFARVFQFGMRHGMRTYTMGSAWWGGDCGPYWGHNALVRIAPFRDHCDLPVLPGRAPLGGRILSHDQVEAVMMRRAGYEVRVLPQETGSWEDNPPTLIEFMRRDMRWCQGNLQYLKLVGMKGIAPMSRFQLAWAIAMFAGLPALTILFVLAAIKPLDGEALAGFPAASALALFATYMVMYMTPKVTGYIDVLLDRDATARNGGMLRFLAGMAVELTVSLLITAAVTLRTSLFIIGLAFGYRTGWSAQARDVHAVSAGEALHRLWPLLVFGTGVYLLAGSWSVALVLVSLPLTLGFVLAIPLAIATASPALGAWMVRTGLCAVPEELARVPELEAVSAIYPDEEASKPQPLPAAA